MCQGNISIKKRYLLLMDFDYTHIFKAQNFDNLEAFYVAVPKGTPFLSEAALNYLKDTFGPQLIFLQAGEGALSDLIERLRPEVLVTLGWRKIIAKAIFDKVPLSLNIHPALLPDYKGYHPLPYLLMNREKEHGLTAHLLSEGVDEGDILLQHRFKINRFSTTRSLIDKATKAMPEFFKTLVETLENGPLDLRPQDPSETKIIAKRRRPSDSELDASQPLEDLFDAIRACDQERFPPYFYVEGEKVYLKLWRACEAKDKDHPLDI